MSSAEISLKGLFDGAPLPRLRCETGIHNVARRCRRGGWPANLGLPDDVATKTAGQYVQPVLDINIIDEGRSPKTALSLMRALALNENQAVTYKTLARDMSAGNRAPDVDTIASYIELLERLELIDNLSGWEPPCAQRLA